MPVTGVRAARPCMMDLQGNCQDPVRLAGSWMLSPNRASGIPTLQLFLSKTSQPSTLPRSGRTTGPSTSIKSCTGVFLTLSYSISLVCATRKCSDIRLRLWYIHDITYIVHTFLFLPPFLIKLKKKVTENQISLSLMAHYQPHTGCHDARFGWWASGVFGGLSTTCKDLVWGNLQ